MLRGCFNLVRKFGLKLVIQSSVLIIKTMKRLLWFFPGLFALSSCEVTVIEPRYDNRDRMVGYYDVEEYSNTYNDYTYYSTQLSKSGYDGNEITLSNFYSVDISIYAYVNNDKITIPFQVVDGYEVEGVGIFKGSGFDLNYSVKDTYTNSRTDFCETKAWIE